MTPPATAHRTPLRLLYTGTSLFILILFIIGATLVLHLRDAKLIDEEDHLKTLSLIVAEQANRTLQHLDLVISRVAETVTAAGVTDAVSLEEKMATRDTHLLLREKTSGISHLDAIIVVGHEGKVINFSRMWPIPAVDISDRTFFRAMKADPDLKREISEPIQNRTTGTWTVYLARRITGANGEFLGLILAAISMRYFEDFYQAISLGKDSSVQIQRLDGVMLVRFPRTNTIGKVFSNSKQLLSDGVSGTVREPSPIDGQMRLKAAHRVSNYPVLALVTKTEHAALADWRSMAWLMSLALLGCTISIAFAAFALGRRWKQQAALVSSQAELQRQQVLAAAMATAAGVAQAAAAQVAHTAQHDQLTGLPNRILLNDRIGQAIARAQRHKKTVAVLFMDLDGFKHINDSLGHAIGDKLLQSMAKRLVESVRRSDTVSRQGGDEFIVLLSEIDEAEGAAVAIGRVMQAVSGTRLVHENESRVRVGAVAGSMLEVVARPHSIDDHDLYITASIGVSLYPDDGLDAETLIQNADTAMYQAKENGRQGYQFFRPEMNARAVERQSIEESLRRAMDRLEFALHYQPIIDLTTGVIIGAEALLRWMHPTRGMIPPGEFIPVAEDCGLMLPIGRWVLREACRQTGIWVAAGFAIKTIAVNLSALEFRDEDFLENLLRTLGEVGLHPRFLELGKR